MKTSTGQRFHEILTAPATVRDRLGALADVVVPARGCVTVRLDGGNHRKDSVQGDGESTVGELLDAGGHADWSGARKQRLDVHVYGWTDPPVPTSRQLIEAATVKEDWAEVERLAGLAKAKAL